MTRDELLNLAYDADAGRDSQLIGCRLDVLMDFARLIAARQRKKDAEICEQRNLRYAIPFVAVEECAAAIREQSVTSNPEQHPNDYLTNQPSP